MRTRAARGNWCGLKQEMVGAEPHEAHVVELPRYAFIITALLIGVAAFHVQLVKQ